MPLPVAQTWFATEAHDHGVTRIYEPHIDPYLAGNSWLIRGAERDLVADTGTGMGRLRDVIEGLTEKPVLALAMVCFYDHAGSLYEFDERGIHRLDAPGMTDPTPESSVSAAYVSDAMLRALPEEGYTTADYALRPAPPTVLFEDGDAIELGGRRLSVVHLPGWTAGSMGLWEEETGLLFTSDALYDDPRFGEKRDEEPPYADPAGFTRSLARLRGLPVTRVHGGHFESFGRERMIELIDGYLESRPEMAPKRGGAGT